LPTGVKSRIKVSSAPIFNALLAAYRFGSCPGGYPVGSSDPDKPYISPVGTDA
jgi:hypothetical protein